MCVFMLRAGSHLLFIILLLLNNKKNILNKNERCRDVKTQKACGQDRDNNNTAS